MELPPVYAPVRLNVVDFGVEWLQCVLAHCAQDDHDAAQCDRLAVSGARMLAGLLEARGAYYHGDSMRPLVEQIAWHYGQGGPQVFFGDIAFYSGEWDARDRVGRVDTNKCRLFMLTGEYDYSCTVEMSEATAAKIPGVRFQAMQGIGHFPFAENPKRFADYLLPILAELEG